MNRALWLQCHPLSMPVQSRPNCSLSLEDLGPVVDRFRFARKVPVQGGDVFMQHGEARPRASAQVRRGVVAARLLCRTQKVR